MKTLVILAGLAVLTAVPATALLANKQKTADAAPAQLAQAAPAPAPAALVAARDGGVRQGPGLTATFVDGSPDVKGTSFTLTPVAAQAPEVSAWEGSFTTAGGVATMRLVQYPGFSQLVMKSSGRISITGEFSKSVTTQPGGYFFPGPIVVNLIAFGYSGWGQIILT